MDPVGLNLPSILTDAEIVFYGGAIAAATAIVQNLSWFPIPEGSKARSWVVAILTGIFIGLSAPAVTHTGAQLVLALVLSYIALGSASLGLNRAGTVVVQKATTGAQG